MLLSDKQCKYFVDLIAKDVNEELIDQHLKNDDFFSVLTDGSTDKSNTEQEMVLICMLKDYKPVTQFVNKVSIPQAISENITAELVKTFKHTLKLQDWKNNLIAACFDGASAMLGHLTGVSTRLRYEASHLITIHCCAHRFELAIKDVWKELPLISEMDNVLKETYNFYKQSRSNRTELKTVAAEQELKLKRPKKSVFLSNSAVKLYLDYVCVLFCVHVIFLATCTLCR